MGLPRLTLPRPRPVVQASARQTVSNKHNTQIFSEKYLFIRVSFCKFSTLPFVGGTWFIQINSFYLQSFHAKTFISVFVAAKKRQRRTFFVRIGCPSRNRVIGTRTEAWEQKND
jgi:hypothetical protein